MGPRDLLVEVRAVSVNPVGIKVRGRGADQAEPQILGYDAAGVVQAVGAEASLFAVGDEVYYAGAINRPGTNTQLHVVDERIVGPKSASLTFAEAAALPLTAITAWEGLFDKLKLTSDSGGTLLMVGASGGVGSVVLQLLRALVPQMRVIATASRPEAEDWVRSLGAHETVNHRGDLRSEIRQVAPEGIDYIFTANSEDQTELYIDVLNPFGQIVAIDDPGSVDVIGLKPKALSWHWEFMFARSLHQAADQIRQHELLAEVAQLVASGEVRSTVTTTLRPIAAEQIREAHRLVESGHMIGKVVITNEA
ncbi:NADPH:quinone reductase [Zafaria cholistanensis]|uniref:Zinc-type alcohol dehydrogenase-like protein n=1 Tax=Zafaria cholistanensis TaxID=1682741 RepID=A0A5A7NPS9_9MICC|nr:NADPH:quinone reductase [Zafaria cholistanensis]